MPDDTKSKIRKALNRILDKMYEERYSMVWDSGVYLADSLRLDKKQTTDAIQDILEKEDNLQYFRKLLFEGLGVPLHYLNQDTEAKPLKKSTMGIGNLIPDPFVQIQRKKRWTIKIFDAVPNFCSVSRKEGIFHIAMFFGDETSIKKNLFDKLKNCYENNTPVSYELICWNSIGEPIVTIKINEDKIKQEPFYDEHSDYLEFVLQDVSLLPSTDQKER